MDAFVIFVVRIYGNVLHKNISFLLKVIAIDLQFVIHNVCKCNKMHKTFYNCHPKYIQACIERILGKMEDFSEGPHILFSADSIPKSQVKKGDPYQDEILETVDLIMENFHGYGHSLCYQRKMKPIKCLKPDIDSELHELYNRGIRNILVFPVSFVSENLETLYHLDIKIRDIAKELGFMQYERADTIQDHPLFIECLQELVLELCE